MITTTFLFSNIRGECMYKKEISVNSTDHDLDASSMQHSQYIYIYIYISGHNWSMTHRVLKFHRSKMCVIYMHMQS